MVKRALAIFHKEVRGVSHAAYFLASFSLLSQILALVRDRLFAAMFGASKTLDLYYAAFRLPDFIFVIVSSLISVSVLIPLIHEMEGKGSKAVKDLISAVFTSFFLCIGSVAIVVYIFTPWIVVHLFPHFAADQQLLVTLTRLLLLSPILLGLSNLFASVTQARQRFIIYGIAPVLYNIGIILGVMVFYPIMGPIGLGVGVVFGAILHAAVQVPYLVKEGLMPVFTRVIDRMLITRIAMLSLPRTLSLSVSEVVEFAMVVIAGTLPFGSISIFNLSWNLQSVPLSIIGVSYAVALFPLLSRLSKEKDMSLFLEKVSHALRQVLFLGAITVAVFIVVRAQIVRTVYGAGFFDWDDTRLTAASLALFVLSFVPQCGILIITRAFYALRDTKRPFITNIISGLCTIVGTYILLNTFLTFPAFSNTLSSFLRVNDLVTKSHVLMLPLAFSIGSWINVLVLSYLFNRKVPGFIASISKAFGIHILTFLGTSVVAYAFLNLFVLMFDTDHLLGIFGQGFLAGILAIAVAVGVLLLFKNREIYELVESVTRSKQKPVAAPDTSM